MPFEQKLEGGEEVNHGGPGRVGPVGHRQDLGFALKKTGSLWRAFCREQTCPDSGLAG